MTTKGNPKVTVRLDPVLKAGMDAYALAKGISFAELVRRILVEFAHRVGANQRGVGATLERVSALIKTLEVRVYSVAIAGIDTQKGREDLYDTALALLKEAVKLSESEEAAKNARARMEAMRLVGNVSRTVLAIFTGYDRRDVEVLLDEVKKTNESLQERLREIEEGTARPREKKRTS